MNEKIIYKICNEEVEFKNYVEVLNPTTEEVYKKVPALSQEQMDKIY